MPISAPRRLAARCFAAALLSLLAVGSSIAQAQEARSISEQAVQLDHVDVLRVSSTGNITPVYAPRLCDQISTHTNASFNGGTYAAQGGFAQGELLAQTYTVPAAEFPIKIVSAEAIFATMNATVSTVTHWSVLFYAGTPTNGQLIDTFSSDDLILPHLRMGPGTNGVNLQFVIDPGDPEQLFIPNNGSNQFTVAFRIDQHNNQTGNPCTTAPASCCNAFPVTDNTASICNNYSQLSQPNLNWLFGLNCGSGGCPANGGWARFSSLQGDIVIGSSCFSGCRPRGDWVMRATWSGANCNPGVGACCVAGQCQVRIISECDSLGGVYQGDGTACGSISCPQPQGACCFPTGFCAVVGAIDCGGSGGTFAGQGTVCGANNTCPLGACCLPSGGCASSVTQAACVGQGGTFRGQGTTCDDPCPPASGACCTSNGFCFLTSAANCTGAGGTFYGEGSVCGAGNSCPVGACCLPNGACVEGVSAAQCLAQSGVYSGNGTTCANANCPQPIGACCTPTGFCFVTTSVTCAGAGGAWKGPGTNCFDGNGNGDPDACEPTCGTADFNNDGDTGTDGDIEAFFACLGGDCCPNCWHLGADFNGDGDVGTDADIESFFRVLSGGNC